MLRIPRFPILAPPMPRDPHATQTRDSHPASLTRNLRGRGYRSRSAQGHIDAGCLSCGGDKHLNSVKIDSLFPWIGGISVFPSFSVVGTPVAHAISSGGHTSGVAARLIRDENCQEARSAPERRCF